MNNVWVGLAIVIAASVAVTADSPTSITYRIKVLTSPTRGCSASGLADDLKGATISEQVAHIRRRFRDLGCAKSN